MPNYNNKGISCVLSENPHASKNSQELGTVTIEAEEDREVDGEEVQLT